MSITLSELEDVIQSWLDSVAGRTVIKSGYDEISVPKSAYCSFRIDETTPQDHPLVKLSEDGDVESIETMILLNVKISFIGGSANAALQRVIASVRAADRNVDLWKNAGLGGFGTAVDLTSLEVGRHRQRWEANLKLYATIKEDFTGREGQTFELGVSEVSKSFDQTDVHPIDKLAGC